MVVIALLTDFGDYYTGIMKGVIRKLSCVEIVDIAHNITPQNVFEGAFLLYHSYKFFPEGTIFIAVVDPGVGGERRTLAIKTSNYWFVCPDNGIAYPSANEDGIERVYVIDENISKLVGKLSSTFHGRDIFAPAGAMIANRRLDYFEEVNKRITKLNLYEYEISEEEVVCRVAFIDRFGNLITNFKREDVERISPEGFYFNGIKFPLVEKYEDVREYEPLSVIGSFETLELSLRNDNLARKIKFGEKSRKISLRWY